MSDTKPWYTSVGVWGSLVALLTPLLRLARVELDPQAQADLVNAAVLLASGVAGGVALYGRLRAKKRIAAAAVPTA